MWNTFLATSREAIKVITAVWEKDIIRVPGIATIGQLTAIPLEKWNTVAGIICTLVTTVYVICKIIHSLRTDFCKCGEKGAQPKEQETNESGSN